MKKKDFFWLALSIIIPLSAGAIGSLFTAPAIAGWYAELAKPAFNPPSWIFAPVWNLLFILMGVALFLIIRRQKNAQHSRFALAAFMVQLILNVFWSFLFFFLQSPGAALMEIIILWLAIFLTIVFSYRVNRTTLWLLLPYLLWVSFASFLNYSIWLIN